MAVQAATEEGEEESAPEEVVSRAMSQGCLSAPGLRELRRRLGLTRGALGILVGVDARTVTRWEKSESDPTGSAARCLAVLGGLTAPAMRVICREAVAHGGLPYIFCLGLESRLFRVKVS